MGEQPPPPPLLRNMFNILLKSEQEMHDENISLCALVQCLRVLYRTFGTRMCARTPFHSLTQQKNNPGSVSQVYVAKISFNELLL